MSLKLLQKINQVFVIFHLITSFLKVRNDCLNLKSKCFHNFLILANLQTQTTIVPRNPLWLVPFFKILPIVHYKKGPIPASFWFFSNTILQKNCRLQRDSNSECWSRRRARWPLDHHHGPSFVHYCWSSLLQVPNQLKYLLQRRSFITNCPWLSAGSPTSSSGSSGSLQGPAIERKFSRRFEQIGWMVMAMTNISA